MARKSKGRPNGATKRRRERLTTALMKDIMYGYARSSLRNKYLARWRVKLESFTKLYAEAERRLVESYETDFKKALATARAREFRHLRKLHNEVNQTERKTKVTRKEGRIKDSANDYTTPLETEQINREVETKRYKGRIGIYAEIGKCHERLMKLEGLEHPELFADQTDSFDIMEIGIGPNTENVDKFGIALDDESEESADGS